MNVVRDGAAGANWVSGIKDKRGMVDRWAMLGFVVKEEGTERFVESERRARNDRS